MKCLRCGCENEADSRFCSKCGMRLVPPKGPVPVGEGSYDPRMEAVQGKP